MKLMLIACNNSETLAQAGLGQDWVDRVRDIAESKGIDITWQNSYSYWHGGGGDNLACLVLNGYGTVGPNMELIVRGIGMLLRAHADTVTDWPSPTEVKAAIEVIEDIESLYGTE